MKKKAAILLICLVMICQVCVFAGDFLDEISLTFFQYVDENNMTINTLSPGGTVKARFKYIATKQAVDFIAAMVIYDSDLISEIISEPQSAVCENESEIKELSYILPENVSNIKIVTFMWSDLENMIPMASPAYFGSADSGIYYINVGSKEFYPLADEKLFNADFKFFDGLFPLNMSVVSRDASTTLEYCIPEYVGNIDIMSLSHNGEIQNNIKVGINTKIEDSKLLAAGSKQYISADWYVKGPAYDKDMRIRSTGMNNDGSSFRGYMNFKIPKIPDDFPLESVELKFYAHSGSVSSGVTMTVYTAVPEWYTGDYGVKSIPAIIDCISIEDAEIPAGTTFAPYVIKIDPEWIKGKTDISLGIVCKYENGNGNPYASIKLTDPECLPYIEFTTAESK